MMLRLIYDLRFGYFILYLVIWVNDLRQRFKYLFKNKGNLINPQWFVPYGLIYIWYHFLIFPYMPDLAFFSNDDCTIPMFHNFYRCNILLFTLYNLGEFPNPIEIWHLLLKDIIFSGSLSILKKLGWNSIFEPKLSSFFKVYKKNYYYIIVCRSQ